MEELYFLIRYTPFWSIPVFLISGEFSYLFWIRKKKRGMLIFGGIAVFAFIMTILYYINGGPEKSVKKVMDLVWYFTR
jgi:hypothetical protein